MKSSIALFKKELFTAKWFLLGGILFFWSFPLLDGIANYHHSGLFRTNVPTAITLGFGAFFAILTAAGMVYCDMSKGVYDFWRSRPVKLWPYIAVKYIMGLILTLIVITTPILLEMYILRNTQSRYMTLFLQNFVYIHTWIIILAYSIAFFTGHLFRTTTETVMVSCAAVLVIYFVPVLVPVLEPLSIFNLTNINMVMTHTKSELFFYIIRQFWLFLTLTSVASFILLAGTWICLKYHIQLRLGLKTLCWCLGLVSLILFSAAAFSVGTNLKCLTKSTLSTDNTNSRLNACFDETGGVLLSGHYHQQSRGYEAMQIDRIIQEPSYAYRHETFVLEKQLSTQAIIYLNGRIAWTSQRPNLVYYLGISQAGQEDSRHQQINLYVIKLDETTHIASIQNELLLGKYDIKNIKHYRENVKLIEQTLYVLLPDEVAVIDVNNNAVAKLLTKVAFPYDSKNDQIVKELILPADNLLSKEQQRQIARYFFSNNHLVNAWDGDRHAEAGNDFVCVYKANDQTVVQKKIAEYKSMPLEKLLYSSARKMLLSKDTVFVLNCEYSLTVYRLNESAGTLKRIGHYAAPEGQFTDMFLRNDGNIALVGTSQIHIVQPPAAKKN